MPRQARKRSDSGTYHVMLRGINKQRIFHEEYDYQSFLDALRLYKGKCGFQLYAWCLMPNHIHLLIGEKPQGDSIGQIMKRICVKYVYWYNLRYERVGPLFQDRFKSEMVQSNAYFMTVLRYIHRNPVIAGIAARPADYRHSSYTAYLRDEAAGLADTSMLFSCMSRDEYEQWHEQNDVKGCLDMDDKEARKGITDDQAVKLLNKACGAANAEAFLKLPDSKQSSAILRMKKSGASLRQISRLTGISLARVRKILAPAAAREEVSRITAK